jgi:hypothetical protein
MARRRDRRKTAATLDPDRFPISEYREYVLAKHQVGPGDLAACSPGEADHVMRVQGLARLPGLYREFLLTMGRNPYPLLPDVDWSYPDLVQIKGEVTRDLRAEGLDTAFLDGALAIGLGGGHFLFYIPDAETAGDDPPVWTCSDGQDREQTYATFRRFLLSAADAEPGAVRIS